MVEEKSAEGATKTERIDFLKQMVAVSESHVRSYDTKAQIPLAAFGLSANPVISIINSACSQASARQVLMILVPTYILTILFFAHASLDLGLIA